MQGIVVQGRTEYYKEICETWKGWPNVVWSTRLDEPLENIDYIRSQGIHVVQHKFPEVPGDQNINYQLISTFEGLNYLHQLGCTEALKIRSDHTVSDVKALLEILWGRKMSFIAIANPQTRPGLMYNLGYSHFGHDYPSDNMIYGKIEDMLTMFNFTTDREYNIPPEALIAYNYMTQNKMYFELSYDNFIRNGMTFFLRGCVMRNIKINWLKKGLEMVEFYNNDFFKF